MNAPLSPGTLVFNRYRVVGLAGQGEFGLTYLAQDQKRFDELCILKEFEPLQQDPDVVETQRQYFHQAASVLYELKHTQVAHYQIMFAQENRLYLARNYIVGKSYSAMLNDRRAEGRAFSQAEVMQFLLQTLPVLTYLHRMGLIHQNLCPQSIVLREQDHLPVLIDFGLVKHLVAQLQLHPVLPGASISRPGYTSPEQQQGSKVLPSSDLYSLGAIAMALLLGQEPQEQAHRWSRTLNWQSQVAIYPEFADILKRLLHPKPQKRFVSASQVFKALQPIAPMVLRSPTGAVYRRIPAKPVERYQSAERPPGQCQFLLEQENLLNEADSATHAPSSRHSQQIEPPIQTSVPKPIRRPHAAQRSQKVHSHQGKTDFKASAVLVMSVALLVSVVAFRTLSWVQKGPEPSTSSQPSPAETTPEAPNPTSTATPEPSPLVQIPTREPPQTGEDVAQSGTSGSLDNRRLQLGVDLQFLADLTDEVFYTKYPDLQGQKLTEEQKDLRNEWTAIAQATLAKLESLSPQTRSKLGSYQRSDYDRWIAPENGASLNNRELNVLVNNRFGELFPDQKGRTLSPKTFGQIWYALAEEELMKLRPQ